MKRPSAHPSLAMPNPHRLDILRQLRDQAGLTQEEMARACGLSGNQSRQTAGGWETGRYIPNERRRAKFIGYLWYKLGLKKDPDKFRLVWEILVEEWGWEPIEDAEWKQLSSSLSSVILKDTHTDEEIYETLKQISKATFVIPYIRSNWLNSWHKTFSGSILFIILLVIGFEIFANTTPNLQPKPTIPLIKRVNTTMISVTQSIAVEIITNGIDQANYIYIPEGSFIMGSDDNEPDEKPMHSVELAAYWIKQTEVTNREYKLCVTSGICDDPASDIWEDAAYADYPVWGINWEQARIYAKWMKGRLPTEAEWEKACRSSDGRRYPWGNQLPFDEFSSPYEYSEIMTVGQHPELSSPYGIVDLIGNVEEWTSTLWGEDESIPQYKYPYTTADGREELGHSTQMRVLRGGIIRADDNSSSGRCTRRSRGYWFHDSPYYGFRVVLNARPKS